MRSRPARDVSPRVARVRDLMPRSVYARFHRMQDEIIRAAMPYPEGRFEGRGIVVCAGGPRLFTCAWVGINMLRRVLGCTLPIQVWYLGPEEMDARMVALLGTLGVECAATTLPFPYEVPHYMESNTAIVLRKPTSG